MATEYFLALGGNQGERLANIKAAIEGLQKHGEITCCSCIYETEPKYEVEQTKFLNLVCCLKTSLSPSDLHSATLQIEKEVGRTQTYRNGPRVIDIDLLYSSSGEFKSDRLTLPHPRIKERAFVLLPLGEITKNLFFDSNQLVSNEIEQIDQEEIAGVKVYANSPLASLQQFLDFAKASLSFKNKTLIMGIINVTPDSFSQDGIMQDSKAVLDLALTQASQMLENGADLLDIGGESSRPGSTPISTQEEIDRTAPIIEAISKAFSVPVSVDTYKAAVAEAALKAGAQIVNDIWALRADPNMAKIIADYNASVVLMHNSSQINAVIKDSVIGTSYAATNCGHDILDTVRNSLRESITLALTGKIKINKIILDPGFGFGKSLDQNLQMLKDFAVFKELGFPLLSGTSRKSFIGQLSGLAVNDRLEGSLASAIIAAMNGANIIRVHDVKETRRVLEILDAVY
jgi:dihydropteroate synthase/2-amino-4-hydroxy-6-hydroxymethyldihydropteridine diphosphokinase